MSQDSFSTTTRTSWLQRLGASLGGIITGLVLVMVGIGLLAWNEARSVAAIRNADEGGRQVVSASTDRIDPALNGRLIHVSGPATPVASLNDAQTGVTAEGLRLVRSVEHYHWVQSERSETRTRLGGGQETVTTYEYAPEWSRQPVSSDKFQRPVGHQTPAPLLTDADQTADTANLGAFRLGPDLIARLPATQAVNPTQADAELAQRRLGRRVVVTGDALYVGDNPAQPKVGDTRIRYTTAPAGPVSVMARQDSDQLAAHQGRHGVIFDIRPGSLDAKGMVQQVKSENQVLSWILRLVGFGMIAAGAGMVLNPLRVLADVLPLAGSIVGAGTGMIALVFAVLVSGVVIALSWLAVRPILALALIGVAGAVAAVLIWRRPRRPRPVTITP